MTHSQFPLGSQHMARSQNLAMTYVLRSPRGSQNLSHSQDSRLNPMHGVSGRIGGGDVERSSVREVHDRVRLNDRVRAGRTIV